MVFIGKIGENFLLVKISAYTVYSIYNLGTDDAFYL